MFKHPGTKQSLAHVDERLKKRVIQLLTTLDGRHENSY
jgi:hypothetical protein